MLGNKRILKILRYIKIYGFSRTLVKALGRLRSKVPIWLILSFPKYFRRGKKVGLIGCGQHSFSSVAYYLTKLTNCKLIWVGDIDQAASSTLAFAYRSKDVGYDCEDTSKVEKPDIVYIISNHSSHTDYAIKYLKLGCEIYIEKPISVSKEQLVELEKSVADSTSNIYVGYNRPHSAAIGLIKESIENYHAPFTLSCFVIGHFLPDDHWYRDPGEGTRIISNLAHWIDLSIHMFSWMQNIPEYIDIHVAYSDKENTSENISMTMTSPRGDLINLIFSCRNEPFEGVNETINYQQDNLAVKIDDFRDIQIWKNDTYRRVRFRPKDNGHKAAVLQPFNTSDIRPWNEIIESTKLVLHIEEMVKSLAKESRYYFSKLK